MVAGDKDRPPESAKVREPTGCPEVKYPSTISRNISRARVSKSVRESVCGKKLIACDICGKGKQGARVDLDLDWDFWR